MKKLSILALLLAVCLCCTGLGLADSAYTTIRGSLRAPVQLRRTYPDNDAVAGISGTTGLPASGEAYTPIIVDLDGGAYPHWGICDADVVYQVPNQGAGSTKLLALFADHYPESAGGVRSARASMVPIAKTWDAAFAYAGIAPVDGNDVNVDSLTRRWGMRKSGDTYKCFNLLGSNQSWRMRRNDVSAPGNLACYVRNIHNELIQNNVTFEQRSFRFTDVPRADGTPAVDIRIQHRGDTSDKPVNPNSTSTFQYDEAEGGYVRYYCDGLDADRDTGAYPVYANVIVVRVQFRWQSGYLYFDNHLVGSGCIEIFQNGHYVQGAWYRDGVDSRLVLVGPDGEELEMQRGKTFIVVTNDVTEVAYR